MAHDGTHHIPRKPVDQVFVESWKKQTLLQSLYDGANDISFRVINFNVIVACGFFAVIVAFQFTVNYIHLLNNFDLKHTFSSLLISVYASLSPILTIVCLLKISLNYRKCDYD